MVSPPPPWPGRSSARSAVTLSLLLPHAWHAGVMATAQSGLVVAFAQALTELITVEKKNIVALTEIAADALRTEPMSAPSIATLIAKRVVMVRARAR